MRTGIKRNNKTKPAQTASELLTGIYRVCVCVCLRACAWVYVRLVTVMPGWSCMTYMLLYDGNDDVVDATIVLLALWP